ITNGTENSVVLLTSTEKSGEPWLLLLLPYHGNTTLIWKTYFGTAPKVARQTQRCSRLVDEGFADGPVESGCRPRLVHGLDVAFGMLVEELFQEAGLAWCGGSRFGQSGG